MNTYGKNDSEIRAQLGESFVVRLSSQPGGGYVWEIKNQLDFLDLTSQSVNPGHEVGGSAVTEFTFVGTHPGEGKLEFLYQRPWENRPLEVLEIPVVIVV